MLHFSSGNGCPTRFSWCRCTEKPFMLWAKNKPCFAFFIVGKYLDSQLRPARLQSVQILVPCKLASSASHASVKKSLSDGVDLPQQSRPRRACVRSRNTGEHSLKIQREICCFCPVRHRGLMPDQPHSLLKSQARTTLSILNCMGRCGAHVSLFHTGASNADFITLPFPGFIETNLMTMID